MRLAIDSGAAIDSETITFAAAALPEIMGETKRRRRARRRARFLHAFAAAGDDIEVLGRLTGLARGGQAPDRSRAGVRAGPRTVAGNLAMQRELNRVYGSH
jgi:hypothetical protein